MACCIIAALILAQITATLRRWSVFWGFIAPGEFDDPDTIFRRLRALAARPAMRTAMAAALALEGSALGGWVYVEHGDHLRWLGNEALARIAGAPPAAAPICRHPRPLARLP